MKPFELMAEVRRLGARPLWPSFNPLSTPVALYDGERTYLTVAPRAFAPEEREATHKQAAADCQTLLDRRSRELEAFESANGWSVIIKADESVPLQLVGFDPMNLTLVGPRALIHGRYLRVGNVAGLIEVFGRQALTEGRGDHPVNGGVTRLTVKGLPARPEVSTTGGRLLFSADGLKGEVTGHVDWGERSLEVVLDSSGLAPQ